MRWILGLLAVLAVYVLSYIVARPNLGQPEPTIDWRDAAWDFWDECAAGPADDDMLPTSAP